MNSMNNMNTGMHLHYNMQHLMVHDSMTTVAGESIPTRPDEISRSLPIPEYKIGWIIGKRGSYINQLAKKSGASISISDSSSKEYGTVWKYVQIRGSGRAVDRAKKLLHIRLERLEPRPAEDGEGVGKHAGDKAGELEDLIEGELDEEVTGESDGGVQYYNRRNYGYGVIYPNSDMVGENNMPHGLVDG